MKTLLITLVFPFLMSVSLLHAKGGENDRRVDIEKKDTLRDDSFDEQLKEAVEKFYQTQWAEAKVLFDSLKEMRPEDPRPHFFESMMPFWEYFFVHKKSDLATRFLEQSESAVALSEQQLDENPSDTTMVFLLSGIHGYRSLVAASEKNYRVAMQSGITGFGYTRQLLSIDTDRPDAQIGRGMFYYMVGSIPGEVRWLTNLAGIRGDVNMGFRELEKASQSDSAVRYDAMMMLMYLHEKENEMDRAVDYAELLTERFPDNVIFHYKSAELHELLGNTTKALDSYRRVVDMDNKCLVDITSLSKARFDELSSLGLNDQ